MSSACAGDSGGPAFIEREGVEYLAAVSSHSNPLGAPPGRAGEIGVFEGYARVSTFVSWIEETLRTVEAGEESDTLLTRPDAPTLSASGGLPDTPAGEAARTFLAAFDSGRADFVAWHRRYANRPRQDRAYADRFERYSARYGTLTARRYKALSPRQILVELEAASGLVEEMLLVTTEDDPPKVETFGFRVLPGGG